MDLRSRIRDHWNGMSPAAQSVCRVLAEISPERLLYMSAVELGAETRTSNATVIRTLQGLGYSGLADLKSSVAGPFTSEIAPVERARRRIEWTGGDPQDVWEKVTAEAAERIELLRRAFSLDHYEAAIRILLAAREVTAFGFGASFVVAEHLALKLRRIGRRARPVHSSGFRLADDLLGIGRDDAVVVFAPGRLPVDVKVLLDRARTVGAASILVSDELVKRLDDSVSVALYAPNTPTGLTGEPLTSMVLADALAQGVAASNGSDALETSHTLTTVRQQLGF
ncbi:MurR/RpiR family transcriptional regulator [Myceligenerans pegani]|uniref:MurR/RpiR family transcriptional regulator n=1 Tax=Myceligenerans pegani TaxID=2776917 RepID=UPI001CF02E2B|nr:MurR/RpiR family transcriptional regulator [Myceligenerans sp. TRM 65318]